MKIILKVENGQIKDIAESYNKIPPNYIEYDFDKYPNDLMGGYYDLIDNRIIKNESRYIDFIAKSKEYKE